MAITAATRQDIIELVETALDAAPGTTLLNELVAIVDGGGTLADVAANLAASDAFTARYPAFQTAEEFADEWLGYLIPEASADATAEAKALVVSAVNGGTSAASLLLQAQDFLSSASESDAAFGTSAANFNNKSEVATYHTVTSETAAMGTDTLSSVTSDDDSVTAAKASVDTVVTPGTSAALTTAVDTKTGGAGADSFTSTTATAASNTLNAGDSITGGAGTDTLSATVSQSGGASIGAGVTTSGVENVKINAVTATTVDAALFSGVTDIYNNGSLSNISYTNAAAIPNVHTISSSSDTSVTFASAATTVGTADSTTIALNGAALTSSNTVTMNGIETFNVVASGTASGTAARSTTLVSDSLHTVTITGDAGSHIAVDLVAATATQTGTVTGNDAANRVTLTADAADVLSVSLGAGNDALNIGSIGAKHTIDGGDGTDTLTSTASITTTTGAGITGFEKISAGAVSIALPATNVIEAVTFTGTGGTVAGVASGATITQAATGSNTVSNATGWTGSSDSLTVNVGSAAAGGAVTQSLTATGIETATVTNNQLSTDSTARSVGVSSKNLTKMTVVSAGDAAITITGGGAALTEVDASGVAGDVTESVTFATAGGKITTAGGDDTITFTAGTNTAITGAGKDSITGGTGADTIDGGAGNDTIDGGKGDDVLTGGDGTDAITGGIGADTMTGGAGADTFTIGGSNTALASYSTATAPDIIKDFVSGTDKLVIAQTNAKFLGNYANLTLALADMTGVNQSFFVTGENNLYVVATSGTYAATDTVVTLEGVTAITKEDIGFGSQGSGSTITTSKGAVTLNTTTKTKASAVTTGKDDTISLIVQDADGNYSGQSTLVGGAGSDTLNLTTTAAGLTVLNAASAADELNVSEIETINITLSDSGAGQVSVTNTIPTDAQAITVSGVNAGAVATLTAADQSITVTNSILGGQASNITMGAFAGTATLGSPNDTVTLASTKNVVSTGAGDDTVNIVAAADGASNGATVSAGAGTDTLAITENITANTTYAFDSTRLTGFETLSITEDATHTITANLMTGITTLTAVATGGGAQTITVTGTAAQINGLTTFTAGATGAAVTLQLSAAGTVDLTDLTFANNAAFTGSTGDDSVSVKDTSVDGFTINGGTGSDTLTVTTALGAADDLDAVSAFETIVLSGAAQSLTTADATLAASGTATINASALTGALTLDLSNEADATKTIVIGSGSADIITGPAAGTTTITAGAGNDTVDNTASGGVITVDLGAGADIFRLDADPAASEVISGGFTAGVAGDRVQIDVSVAGLGSSTITSGAGVTTAATGAATVFQVIDQAAEAIATTSNVLILAAGQYANAAAAVAALNAGGALASPTIPTAGSTAVADNSEMLIMYENSDGDAVLANVLVNGAVSNGGAMAFDTGDDLVTFTGQSLYTGTTIDFIASNLQFI